MLGVSFNSFSDSISDSCVACRCRNAAWAASLALRNSLSCACDAATARLRSVTSSAATLIPTISPAAFRSGCQ